ncbi:YdeI/OmpD-associated family protein [Paenisporosarcina sp. FSL H8-0542]|uniref:YdeI/OmpD-associated family protein n=1 Tax=Paenisporosarcina sp. FSL H8-0542 TaxID=2921401 RepID=UPI00315AE314
MNSTKTVIEKLGIHNYSTKLILNKPETVHDFEDLHYDTTIKDTRYQFVFVFTFTLEDFTQQLNTIIDKNLIEDNGYLYFAYPKKKNPTYKEFIERDRLYEDLSVDEDGYVRNSQLKFSRMVSLNETFTIVGLKSLPKKPKKTDSIKNSQCADDYIEYVEHIKEYLSRNEDLLEAYNKLTFGYQKDWARYVYSAKKLETQEKRLLEMETILGEGFKSMDLFRRKKK